MTSARRERPPALPSLDLTRTDARHSAPVEPAPLPPSEPAPRLTPAPHNNLSLPRSPLIGRDHEIAVIQQLLLQEQVGLLTLTGPGGIGKTRLAMQVAANLLDHFVDGVYFVSLAPISDPELVSAAIAQTLGVREAAGQPIQASLQAYLHDRQLLLVLDNFEQILAAAPLVSALLTTCQRLKVLVTSRATLHLYGEQEFPVPPLALPDVKQLPFLEKKLTSRLTDYAAMELFCQRAKAVKPDFALTPSNAATVAEICIRLDGLPLAIELAAARIKLFSPSALLARLDQRLTLLTGGPHDQPARQHTLRDSIAWSYDLLSADEQTLFRRLAVFVGGFTLEAAQAVGNADGALTLDVLGGITTLVDHNLLKQVEQPNGEAHFGMLETIREYGLERLEASGEAATIRQKYANFFLKLVERIAPVWRGADQGKGLACLTKEYANLRTVLAWSQGEGIATGIALRLAGAMTAFWLAAGYWREGRRWLETALACSTVERTEPRAQVLISVGFFASMQGDLAPVHQHLEEGMTIAKECGTQHLIVDALIGLAGVAVLQRNPHRASTLLSEAQAIAYTIDDKYRIGVVFVHSGKVASAQQDHGRAQLLYEEGLAYLRQVGAEWDIVYALVEMAKMAQHQQDYERARTLFKESLKRWRTLDLLKWKGVADCLEGLAGVCMIQQQFTDAMRLFGMGETIGKALSPLFRSSAVNTIATLRTQLDEATFAAAWAEGCSFTAEEAIAYALALPEIPISVPISAIPTYPAGLTAREVEVLRLVAQGLSYTEIADKLVISHRTVNTHVTSIYSKLGVTGRAAATSFALEHHLL